MRWNFAVIAAAGMLLLLPCLPAAPAGIRPVPPPDPLGIRGVAAVEQPAEARKPGPPPDPLRGDAGR